MMFEKLKKQWQTDIVTFSAESCDDKSRSRDQVEPCGTSTWPHHCVCSAHFNAKLFCQIAIATTIVVLG